MSSLTRKRHPRTNRPPGHCGLRRPRRIIFTYGRVPQLLQKVLTLVPAYRHRVIIYRMSRGTALESTVFCRYDLAHKTRGRAVMMGFETLALVLFVGWVLATSLFLRFG